MQGLHYSIMPLFNLFQDWVLDPVMFLMTLTSFIQPLRGYYVGNIASRLRTAHWDRLAAYRGIQASRRGGFFYHSF